MTHYFKGTTIASYKEEITALRGFLSTKDEEITRLQNENMQIKMPKPIYQSSPNEVKNKSKRMKGTPSYIKKAASPPYPY